MSARASLLALSAIALHAAAEPTIAKTNWREFEAFALSDGRSEAIVVPALGGRTMSYG